MIKKVNKNKFSFVALIFAFMVFAFNFLPLTNVVENNNIKDFSSSTNLNGFAPGGSIVEIGPFYTELLFAQSGFQQGSNGTTSSDNCWMVSGSVYRIIGALESSDNIVTLRIGLTDNNNTFYLFNNVTFTVYEDIYSVRGSRSVATFTGLNYLNGVYFQNDNSLFISSNVSYYSSNRAQISRYCGVVPDEFDNIPTLESCSYCYISYFRDTSITGVGSSTSKAPGYIEFALSPFEVDDDNWTGQGYYFGFSVPCLEDNYFYLFFQKVISNDSDYASGYNYGYEIGEEIGYNNGYNVGYQRGFASADSYPLFYNLFSAVVDAPIHSLLSLVNVEILGINVQELFTALISIAFIICVIRLFTGG